MGLAEDFNKRLKERFGISSDNGMPIFQLVWSESILEKRHFDVFNKITESGIWLGAEYDVVKEGKKYSYLKDRWVLEVYTPEQVLNPEIMNPDKYEPLFVFQDKNGNSLRPAWFALEYACQRYLWAKTGSVPKRTEKMDTRVEEEEIDKETLQMMDYLGQEDSTLSNRFHYKEAVLIHRED